MHAALIDADRMHRRLSTGAVSPAEFHAALLAVPPTERDRWADRALGIDPLHADGPDLPRGCVPYLPCDVETLLRMIEAAAVTTDDVFVDVGAGVGRAAALVHLLTGADTIAVEVQAGLVAEARALVSTLELDRLTVVAGDVAAQRAQIARGTVFFLYCPFSGDRLDRLLDDLAAIARPLRICTVDLPLPQRPDLTSIWRDDRLLVCRMGG